MKDFDINLAKKGHPVCTRDGRAARIICWDCASVEGEEPYPIVALVTLSEGNEYPYCYDNKGKFSHGQCGNRDLMLATVKHKGWVNIYQFTAGHYSAGQSVYKNEEDAVHSGKGVAAYIATAKIEWEE